MAVENKYVNADVVADRKGLPSYVNSDEGRFSVTTFEVAAADDDGSIYRLFRINSNMIPFNITITNDAITGGTDYELGIYNTLGGPQAGSVKDLDVLMGTTSMASARAEGSGVSGLTAVSQENATQRLWELAGDTASNHPSEYDIALTANTVGTAAGTITVKAEWVQG